MEPETQATTILQEHNMTPELLELFGRKSCPSLDPTMLPRLLRDYLDLGSQITDAQPGMLLSAWLPFIAVNIGNRVHMLSNCQRIYPNLWSCLIGPSSVSRKTTSIRLAELTLENLLEPLEGLPNEEFEAKTPILSNVTLSKLFSLLAINPERVFVHHELSGWLGEMNKHFNVGYKQAITEIYDGVNKSVHTQTRTERIRKPSFNVVASTTEAWIYKNIRESSDQLGGFLQRFIYCVIRDVKLDEIKLELREDKGLERDLPRFGIVMQTLKNIPGDNRLCLSPDAVKVRNELYDTRYRKWFARNNDALMSYFTRLYDGYFFKFCLIFTLLENLEALRKAQLSHNCAKFLATLQVSDQTAWNAVVLCDYYLANTIPFLEIVEEQDKLAGERKLVDLLVQKYGGKARHSELLNKSHMRKREFRDCIETLLEREAVSVVTHMGSNNKPAKMYVVNPGLIESWAEKPGPG